MSDDGGRAHHRRTRAPLIASFAAGVPLCKVSNTGVLSANVSGTELPAATSGAVILNWYRPV
jgi:hypothetical protein